MRTRHPRLVLILTSSFALCAPATAAPECSAGRAQTLLALLNPAAPEASLVSTLAAVEEECPDLVEAAPKIQPLLRSAQVGVRRAAIRVFGLLQPALDADALADVQRMLASSDAPELVDALKGSRWLRDPALVASFVRLLGNPDEHVKREACTALAMAGDRNAIPSLEPLTRDPIADVRSDCEGAIAQLRRKP